MTVTGPTPPEPGPGDGGALALSSDEREVVGSIAEAYASAVPTDLAAPYLELADAVRAGSVPSELLDVFDRVCTLALQTGKARQLGRAEAERVLLAVLRRSPGGRALARAVEDVNDALRSLAGRPLRSVRASMRLPGRYTLVLEVEGLRLTLGLGPEGLGVESLAAG